MTYISPSNVKVPIIAMLVLANLVSGCGESVPDQTKAFLTSQGMKQLAAWGRQLIDTIVAPADETGANLEQSTSPRAIVLVSSKGDVGHRDFMHAKQVLLLVYAGMEEEFYCGCRYHGKTMDLDSCGYTPRKNADRAARLEWEHVVPAWTIGHLRQCWQSGGRKNCTANDPVFSQAEGDLNNLVPSIGEVNGDRSNFPYSAWSRNPEPIYGQCKTVVDFKLKRAQPREEVRGRAARISLYMAERYQLRLSKQDKQLFCAWAKTYPVDDWEIERNRRIVKLQGEGNPFVTDSRHFARLCSV